MPDLQGPQSGDHTGAGHRGLTRGSRFFARRCTAVANGAETGRVQGPGSDELRFAETELLPSYLFAFAAGRFAVETAERNGRTLRLVHRETDAAKLARSRDALLGVEYCLLCGREVSIGAPRLELSGDDNLLPLICTSHG